MLKAFDLIWPGLLGQRAMIGLKDAVVFVLILGLCFFAVWVGTLFGSGDSIAGWYGQLQKPSFNPPRWIFGPVWSILYVLMGISAFIIWQKGISMPSVRLALAMFCVQLLLNAAWTPIFFGYHLIGWAFVEIVILWAAIIAMIIAYGRVSVLAACLQIPYLLWVSFAVVLNGTLWYLNK